MIQRTKCMITRIKMSVFVSKRKVMLLRIQSTIILNGVRVQKSALSCEQTTSDALPPTIDGTGRKDVRLQKSALSNKYERHI